MSNVSIRAEGISKRYYIGKRNTHRTLREGLVSAAKEPFRRLQLLLGGAATDTYGRQPIWVLRDIDFEIQQGQVVGLIGRNGAGKSTLLKILSRITEPTRGWVEVRGRVRSLLEVGTGFHPELTGRENVYLNGVILGMRKKEIDRKFDEIVAFSEIEQFLDTPVKHYSSGMYVRLAFAVAAHLDPEILIIDEVLSVGDTAFQSKCLGKVGEVSRGGRTVLFVSHNMAAVENLCQRAIVLREGRLVYDGAAKDGISKYLHTLPPSAPGATSHVIDLTQGVTRRPEYTPLLLQLELLTGEYMPLVGNLLPIGATLTARIRFKLPKPTSNFHVVLGFENEYGQRIFTACSIFDPNFPNGTGVVRTGEQLMECRIPSLNLVPGDYTLKLSLTAGEFKNTVDAVEDAARLQITEADYYGTGKLPWKSGGVVVLRHGWRLL
jgi:lipopolysaccharide transport system ATP-binding protein